MPAVGASEGVDHREEIADVDVRADSTRIDRAFKVEEAGRFTEQAVPFGFQRYWFRG